MNNTFLSLLAVFLVLGTILIGLLVDKSYSESTQKAKQIQIPSWVKHSAGWWSEDRISDQDYLKSIQYLIDQGTIKIK